MKKALGIITYSRVHYFELVLPSILCQTIQGRPVGEIYDLYVFQDGLYSGEIAADRDGHDKIWQFLSVLPDTVQVIRQDRNLGVAMHFDFIERFLFNDKGYDFVLFCEDDLILAPGYVTAVDLMAEKFHDDTRVGMVSAHPHDPTIPIEIQRANRHQYGRIGHHWGFGLTRSFWEKRQPLVDCYLDLIRDVPYRHRPTKLINEWLRSIGLQPGISSQDHIKACATSALGAVRLATFPNYGLPIGRTGLHCTPELFTKNRLHETVIFDQELKTIDELDDTQFLRLYLDSARTLVSEKFLHTVRAGKTPVITDWQARLAAGEFHPSRVLSTGINERKDRVSLREWNVSDIPTRPHMRLDGIALLEQRLRNAMVYLEYGSGGSTVFAAEMGVQQIHSIDSDLGLLDALKRRVAKSFPRIEINVYYVDIGPTREWGHPTSNAYTNRWPKYCVAAWDALILKGRCPDLILIDGRFRVACFLASLLFAKPGTIILFDDYFDRPQYHLIQKYLQPSTRAGRMAEFVVDSPLPETKVMFDLMAKVTDPG